MVTQLKPGQHITEYFILRSKERRTKKNNEAYLSLELGDASGRIFGSLWENIEQAEKVLEPGALVKVRATVIEWHGRNHLSVEKVRLVNERDKISIEQFLPQSSRPLDELMAGFKSQIAQVENAFLRQVLERITANPQLEQAVLKAPGGKLWHHCYLGGLLEHTLKVAELALTIARHYEHIDRDLLLTGALLHDIGKCLEYQWAGFIDYSDIGRLHGHITIGYHLVAQIIDAIDDFPPSLRNELLHLILSHQGQKEHGSPVEPMMREAIILNFADELDSKLGAFDRIYHSEYEPGRTWSNYVNLLDRFLYFGKSGA